MVNSQSGNFNNKMNKDAPRVEVSRLKIAKSVRFAFNAMNAVKKNF